MSLPSCATVSSAPVLRSSRPGRARRRSPRRSSGGDSYFAEHEKEAKAQILEWVKAEKPDLFLAGPAFNAGRYGYACATICKAVQDELGIKVLTGMYEENPGADLKNSILIVSTANSAAGMRKAAPVMGKARTEGHEG